MSDETIDVGNEREVRDAVRNAPPEEIRITDVGVTVAGTILESEIPEGTGRFPQWGSEHPDKYKEFYVTCSAHGGTYPPLRGRAVDGYEADLPYLNAASVNPDHSPELTVREIIEG